MNLLLFNLAVDRDHTALGFTTDWINELARHFEAITVVTMYRGRVEVAPNVTVLSAGRENGWSKPRRVAAFYGALFKALRLTTIGRISPVKNIDLMLRAFAGLRARKPGLACSLTIIGEAQSERDRNYVDACRTLATALGVHDVVAWLPPVPFDKVNTAYHRGDIFLSANDNGLDKAILEAMASGLPVIAMHPALKAPLGQFYVESEAGFGEALISLASLDHEARREIGSRLRRYVESKHSLSQLGRRITEQLQAIAL